MKSVQKIGRVSVILLYIYDGNIDLMRYNCYDESEGFKIEKH